MKVRFNGKAYRVDLRRFVKSVGAFIGLLAFAWLVLSWVDVALHNCTDQAYAGWNAWTLLLRGWL